MSNYYGVVRTDEYLAHYGIKGMRWGVQKAVKKGSIRAYNRQYKKAMKHLNRLEKYANSGAKYTRKAITKGLGTAATIGTVAMGIRNPGMIAYKAGLAGYNAYRAATADKAANRANLFRDEMEKQFDPGRVYASSKYKRKRRR